MPKIPDKNYSKVFEAFGVVFAKISGDQAQADECPFCGKDRFSVNVKSGQYDCKKCQESGNVTIFLTKMHKQFFEATTTDDYLALKAKRGGIATQTLRDVHQLAYDRAGGRWLIPFKNANGNVVNIQFYHPNRDKPNKFNLPLLPTAIYGFDNLTDDKKKIVFLCEGPFDAIALDWNIGATKRSKYVILATPGTFKEAWVDHFKGRKVRALYDNDDGGRQHRERVQKLLGESKVAEKLEVLLWPDKLPDDKPTPDGYDINDLASQYPKTSIVGFTEKHCVKVIPTPKLIFQHGRRNTEDEIPKDWPWPNHLCCNTYVSFSGRQGTFKSTIMQEIAARYTTGQPMPMCKIAGMPAGHVLYIYAEDDRADVENGFEWAGGDITKLISMPATVRDGDPLNILDHLREFEQTIREKGIRLVIIDGQNSVVGAPNISTDMLARCNVTNKLHQFAQRLNICLIGIRNEDADGRALGPQSMGDIGRCVLRAVENEPISNPPYCKLMFVKVSGRARVLYPPIPYSVQNLGGSHRKILWGAEMKDEIGKTDAIFANGTAKSGASPTLRIHR